MGPYGSVGAHIKTGRSPMAHDHFQTPPDPKRDHKNPKLIKQLVFFSRGGHHPGWDLRVCPAVALAASGESALRARRIRVWIIFEVASAHSHRAQTLFK